MLTTRWRAASRPSPTSTVHSPSPHVPQTRVSTSLSPSLSLFFVVIVGLTFGQTDPKKQQQLCADVCYTVISECDFLKEYLFIFVIFVSFVILNFTFESSKNFRHPSGKFSHPQRNILPLFPNHQLHHPKQQYFPPLSPLSPLSLPSLLSCV